MEDFYAEPDERLKARRRIEYTSRFIEPLFPADRSIRIVDLGCGYGLFLDACRRLGYEHADGVEQSGTAAEYAEKELGLRHIIRSDLIVYLESKESESLDVITALNIVEHVKRERVSYLLELICQKIKPGGLFIMEVPNADSPLGVSTYFSDLTHESAFSRKLGLRLLRLAGFSDIEIRYQPNIRNPLVQLAQKLIAKIIGFEHRQMFSGNIVFVARRS